MCTQSGLASTPPDTLSHSTTTVPLNFRLLIGRSTTTRVLYAAGVDGVTVHFPSLVSAIGRRVRVRGALEEELGLGVSDRAEVERGVREHERYAVAARDRAGDRRPIARGLGDGGTHRECRREHERAHGADQQTSNHDFPLDPSRPHLTAGEVKDVSIPCQPLPRRRGVP